MKAISLTSVVVVVAVMVVQLHQSEAGNDIVSVSKFKKFAVAKEIKDWIRSTGVIPDDICKQIVEASLGPNYSDTVGELTSVKQIDKTVEKKLTFLLFRVIVKRPANGGVDTCYFGFHLMGDDSNGDFITCE